MRGYTSREEIECRALETALAPSVVHTNSDTSRILPFKGYHQQGSAVASLPARALQIGEQLDILSSDDVGVSAVDPRLVTQHANICSRDLRKDKGYPNLSQPSDRQSRWENELEHALSVRERKSLDPSTPRNYQAMPDKAPRSRCPVKADPFSRPLLLTTTSQEMSPWNQRPISVQEDELRRIETTASDLPRHVYPRCETRQDVAGTLKTFPIHKVPSRCQNEHSHRSVKDLLIGTPFPEDRDGHQSSPRSEPVNQKSHARPRSSHHGMRTCVPDDESKTVDSPPRSNTKAPEVGDRPNISPGSRPKSSARGREKDGHVTSSQKASESASAVVDPLQRTWPGSNYSMDDVIPPRASDRCHQQAGQSRSRTGIGSTSNTLEKRNSPSASDSSGGFDDTGDTFDTRKKRPKSRCTSRANVPAVDSSSEDDDDDSGLDEVLYIDDGIRTSSYNVPQLDLADVTSNSGMLWENNDVIAVPSGNQRQFAWNQRIPMASNNLPFHQEKPSRQMSTLKSTHRNGDIYGEKAVRDMSVTVNRAESGLVDDVNFVAFRRKSSGDSSEAHQSLYQIRQASPARSEIKTPYSDRSMQQSNPFPAVNEDVMPSEGLFSQAAHKVIDRYRRRAASEVKSSHKSRLLVSKSQSVPLTHDLEAVSAAPRKLAPIRPRTAKRGESRISSNKDIFQSPTPHENGAEPTRGGIKTKLSPVLKNKASPSIDPLRDSSLGRTSSSSESPRSNSSSRRGSLFSTDSIDSPLGSPLMKNPLAVLAPLKKYNSVSYVEHVNQLEGKPNTDEIT